MKTLGTISQLLRPKPQPAAAPPGPTQVLPIKTYREPAPLKPKAIHARSKVEDLVEVVGPGQFKVRIPAGYDFRVKGDPFAWAAEYTRMRLLKEMASGDLVWPDGITAVPRKTREEQRAERIATIRRVAEGPKDYAAMLANEGFNVLDHPWDPPSDEQRTERLSWRKAREIRGLLRGRIFGS